MRIVNVLEKKKKKTLCVESFSTLFYTKRHKFVKNICILIPEGWCQFCCGVREGCGFSKNHITLFFNRQYV